MSTRIFEDEAERVVRRVHRDAVGASRRIMCPVDAGSVAQVRNLVRQAAEGAASPYEAVREFSLGMAEIRCPHCRETAYPDSMGEAIDWAMGGHECDPEADSHTNDHSCPVRPLHDPCHAGCSEDGRPGSDTTERAAR